MNFFFRLTPYLIASRVMDFLREVFLYRGNLLIIEDDNLSVNSKPDKLVLRTALLFCLTYFFRCSVYETWTLINSQVAHLPIFPSALTSYFFDADTVLYPTIFKPESDEQFHGAAVQNHSVLERLPKSPMHLRLCYHRAQAPI